MTRPDALDMMVTYLGVDPGYSQKEMDDTRECHVRFSFIKKLYKDHLTKEVEADGDNAQVFHQ